MKNALDHEIRPWGEFFVLHETNLDNGLQYAVKKLVLYPEKRYSYQKHQHRSEHWLVVAGEGVITLNNQSRVIHAGESVDIPHGTLHRLANNSSDVNLEVIEVQMGEIDEHDIERLEDDFDRTNPR